VVPTDKSASKPAKGELRDLHILKLYDHLPLSAVIPVSVAAAIKGVDEKTIRRNYSLVPVSDRRVGVRKCDLVDVAAA
jgi:hypothetical protein